jgi:hypothetical protein
MATTATLYTAEELAKMPTDQPWELWDGELKKVPGAGGTASDLAQWMRMLVGMFVRPNRLGMVTGGDGT